MLLLIIIPMKNGYFIGNINPTYPTFSDKATFKQLFQMSRSPVPDNTKARRALMAPRRGAQSDLRFWSDPVDLLNILAGG